MRDAAFMRPVVAKEADYHAPAALVLFYLVDLGVYV
jgi:hypothetical protein